MRKLLLGIVVAVGILALSTGAYAEGGGTGDGTLFVPSEYATIALALANTDAGDTINIAAGTYNEADLVVDKQLTMQGAGSATTVIDATGASTDYGILLTAGGTSAAQRLTITGLTVKNSPSHGIKAYKAGGLNLDHVTLENLVLTLNGSRGMEIHNDTAVSDMEITNCEFVSNGAQGLRTASNVTVGGMVITDSKFNQNTYGIYLQGTINGLTILRATFDNNTDWGGYLSETGPIGNVVIEDSQFDDNSAGYGLVFYTGSSQGIHGVRIARTSFNNNRDGMWYGADVLDTILIEESSVVNDNNTGRRGIYFSYGALSSVEVHCTNIVGNSGEAGLSNYATGTVDATENWWGAADGPSGEGSGSGDAVSAGVDFSPFLTSAPEDSLTYTGGTVFSIDQNVVLEATLNNSCSGGIGGVDIDFTGDLTGFDITDAGGVAQDDIGTQDVGVYEVLAAGGGLEANAIVVVYDPNGGFVTGGGWIESPSGALKTPPAFFNGFETDIDGWITPTRVMSGTNGIPSASSGYHAETAENAGDFTRWGGYNSTFPSGGYITSIDIYLDVDDGFVNDTRFDWTSAISSPAGGHRRDFVFTGGFYDDATGPGAGVNRFVFSASNNTPGWPKNPGRDPIAITTTGWYTLQHRFYDSGGGILAVDLSILDSTGNVINTWTLSDPTDVIGDTVGGNRYGWFATNGFPFLAIDNSVRKEINDLIGKANFGFVSKYKKGASVPTGNTEFMFQAADLNFHSSSYEWLVVTGGDYAKFKGIGTINGESAPNAEDYKFKLWAGDDDPDTFRIKIWWEENETEHVVYDNGMDQPIGGVNIVIHTKKK
jgi:hypothetical protein